MPTGHLEVLISLASYLQTFIDLTAKVEMSDRCRKV